MKSIYLGKNLPSRADPAKLLTHMQDDMCPGCHALVTSDPDNKDEVTKALQYFQEARKKSNSLKAVKTKERRAEQAADEEAAEELLKKAESAKQGLLSKMWKKHG